jgi:hypothetical protein
MAVMATLLINKTYVYMYVCMYVCTYLCTNIKIKTAFKGTYPEPGVSPLHKNTGCPTNSPTNYSQYSTRPLHNIVLVSSSRIWKEIEFDLIMVISISHGV